VFLIIEFKEQSLTVFIILRMHAVKVTFYARSCSFVHVHCTLPLTISFSVYGDYFQQLQKCVLTILEWKKH